MMDTCHYLSVQIHKLCNTEGESRVNYGLCVIMVFQCRFILGRKRISQGRDVDDGEGVGLSLSLYLPLNFVVNINCSKK